MSPSYKRYTVSRRLWLRRRGRRHNGQKENGRRITRAFMLPPVTCARAQPVQRSPLTHTRHRPLSFSSSREFLLSFFARIRFHLPCPLSAPLLPLTPSLSPPSATRSLPLYFSLFLANRIYIISFTSTRLAFAPFRCLSFSPFVHIIAIPSTLYICYTAYYIRT